MSAPNNFPIKENIIMKPCHNPDKNPDSYDSYPSGAHEVKQVEITINRKK